MAGVPDHIANLEILQAACCVAGQDGRISSEERPLIERLADRAGVGDKSLQAMIEMAESNPEFSRNHFSKVQTDPAPTIRALAEVATADGTVTDEQQQVLVSFAERLGIDEQRLQSILNEAR